MNVFAQIRKVDEAKRLVFGRAAEEVVDRSGEIMDYASTKPHFQKWSADVTADSDGKSMGNLRAMHGKVAAGKLTAIDFDDEAKAIDVCAKVVDDAEWKKVLEGVYTGFSIGGSYVGEAKVEKINGQDVKRYTAKPNELSLVDRPCIPTATFFEVQKADGSTAKVDFIKVDEAAAEHVVEASVQGEPADVDELVKIMAEAKLGMRDVIGHVQKALTDAAAEAAKPKPAAAVEPVFADTVNKRFPITDAAAVRRSFATMQKLDIAQRPVDVATAIAKAWAEKVDKAGIPADAAAIETLAKQVRNDLRKGLYSARGMLDVMCSLQSLMQCEAYEAYSEADNSPVPGMIKSVVSLCGQIVKSIVDEELSETPNEAAMVELSAKAGDLAKLDADALANLVKALPAHADAVRAALPAPKADAPQTEIQKLLDERLAPLTKQLAETQAELLRISQQPAPARVSLRAVSKQADAIEENHQPAQEVQKIVDGKGVVNESASLIKQIQQRGGQPITLRLAK